MPIAIPSTRPSPWPLLALWTVLLLALWTAVCLHLNDRMQTHTQDIAQHLDLIATARARALEEWWTTHESNASLLALAAGTQAPVYRLKFDSQRKARAGE